MPRTFHVLTCEQVLRRYAVQAESAEHALELAGAALADGRLPGPVVFSGQSAEEVLDAEAPR